MVSWLRQQCNNQIISSGHCEAIMRYSGHGTNFVIMCSNHSAYAVILSSSSETLQDRFPFT